MGLLGGSWNQGREETPVLSILGSAPRFWSSHVLGWERSEPATSQDPESRPQFRAGVERRARWGALERGTGIWGSLA